MFWDNPGLVCYFKIIIGEIPNPESEYWVRILIGIFYTIARISSSRMIK